MIYWLTGQPGAGKTTLGTWIMASFPFKGFHIDGDDMRNCFQDKDYSEAGRRKNVEKAQTMAKFMHYKGNTVIVSFVSPYRDQREEFKKIMGDYLIEIYVHTSDDRGRTNFFVADYEAPLENFVDCDTTDSREYQTFLNLRRKLKI
jgi:adenylylsulfate kinase-like enzyme